MKKLLSILTLCMLLCCVSCYDDSHILERLEALEKNAIASINEQISSIKASIISLESVDKELKATIRSLESKDSTLQNEIEILKSEDTSLKGDIEKLEEKLASVQNEIAPLKEKDSSLEAQIRELKSYVDDEISGMKDWTRVTFTTLEQYDSLCVVLTCIETSISDLKEEFKKNLSDAILNSEESMKSWVNEQLTGYWTIAEMQARLDTLKQTHNEDIEKLFADLADTKKEMTEAYTTAISNAIEELDGSLSDDITKINDELTNRMDDIEDRLSAVEETLKNLTRDFSISFDDYDIGILAGGTRSVDYTITGATEKTTVKALGQNGWSAKVTPEGADKGKITVTAPNPMTDDEIIVLVYDGEYRTIMSSINFVTGVVAPSQTIVELEDEAGTIDIMVNSNLNYKVSIPRDTENWLSLLETKSLNTDKISFSYTKNEGDIRKTNVILENEGGCELSNIVFVQKGSPSFIIEFEDHIMKELCITAFDINQDGNLSLHEATAVTDISLMKLTNRTFKSFNEFKYFTSVKTIPDGYFKNVRLVNITLPSSLTSIGNETFSGCTSLVNIVLSENIETIGDNAFYNCSSLADLELTSTLNEIGYQAFCGCSSLKSILIPESVSFLGGRAFSWCSSLESIVLSEGIEYLPEYTFASCSLLKSILIPNSVTSIGDGAFSDCFSLETIRISDNVKYIGDWAFERCTSLKDVVIPYGIDSINKGAFYGCSLLDNIRIPETILSIGAHSFKKCSSLTNMAVPESVFSIGDCAFEECIALSSITIPESVTTIGYYAFGYCESLKSILIPESVTHIGFNAFHGNSDLESVYLMMPTYMTYDSFFEECNKLNQIYVPKELENTYKQGWNEYANIIEVL